MRTSPLRLDLLVLFVLVVLTGLAHWQLPALWLALNNSDYAWLTLEALAFRQGQWTLFYEGQSYGGITLAILRALFPWSAQGFFSFVVCPILMTLAHFFLLRSTFSLSIAGATSVLLAIGLGFWVGQYGNDFYVALMILAPILLALRARIGSIWTEASERWILLLGLFCGFLVYTHRASLVFVVAVLLPYEALPLLWKRFKKPADRWEKGLRALGLFFLGLFLFLEIYGSNLGTWSERAVKLHAGPNLRFAFIAFLAWGLWAFRKKVATSRSLQRRAGLLGIGLFVGFLPELIFWWSQGVLKPPTTTGTTAGFATFFHTVGEIPRAISDLVTSDGKIDRIFPLLAATGGMLALTARTLKDARLLPITTSGALALFAYCRISVYAEAPSRYLVTLYPALVVSWACWMDWSLKNRRSALALFAALAFLGTGFHSARARVEMVQSESLRKEVSAVGEIAHAFLDEGRDLVFATYYWKSHVYSLPFAGKPAFYSPGSLNPKLTVNRFKGWQNERDWQSLGMMREASGLDAQTLELDGFTVHFRRFKTLHGLDLFRAESVKRQNLAKEVH